MFHEILHVLWLPVTDFYRKGQLIVLYVVCWILSDQWIIFFFKRKECHVTTLRIITAVYKFFFDG